MMEAMSNRYLALELAARSSASLGNSGSVTDVARAYLAFLDGETASVGEAPAASSGKKSRAKPAAATAAATDTAPVKSAAEEDLFGSASEATTPAKSPTASTTSTATKAASPSEDDDLFGEKAAPAKETPKATIEQLRKALTECQTKHGHKDHALGVLKKFTRDGNPTISTLDEAKYQAVIDACASYVPAK
jgi:hypothetical protein